MKAVQIKEFGGVEVLKIADVDRPKPGKGQTLIEVHASSINPVDAGLLSGRLQKMFPMNLPAVLGWDIAGTIVEVGEDGNTDEAGVKVYGQASPVAGGSGAFAEYAVAPSHLIARMPKNLDFNEAAAISLVGLSAVQGINEHLKLKPGQKILIHGGAGGIGSIAIQLAKHIGAYVATTATDVGIDFVKKLGADEVIDYAGEDFAEQLSDFDAVFDNVGGDVYAKSFSVLKKGGTIVSMTHRPDEDLIKKYEVNALYEHTETSSDYLNELTKLIEDGVITVNLDKTYPLDQIAEAFRIKQEGHVRGKIAVEVRKQV